MSPPSTHKGNDWSEEDCIRFSLQQVVPELPVSPVDPVPAKKFTDPQIERKQLSAHKEFLYHENVYAYDAMVTGWILYPPCNFSVEEDDGNSYTVVAHQLDENSEVVEVVEVDGEEMLAVNSLWTIEFPDKYIGLVTHPATHTVELESNPVVPKVISQQSSTEDLELLLNIDGEFTMTIDDPLAQLITVDDEIISASYRNATSDEMEAIEKEERRKELYPDEYGKRRDEQRWGDVLSIQN